MELERPDAATPSILMLLAPGDAGRELSRRVESHGLHCDTAHLVPDTYNRFVERGGHEAMVLVGKLPAELEAAALAICEVSPEIRVLRCSGTAGAQELEDLCDSLLAAART